MKSWRVKNTGGVHWPHGTALCFVEGKCTRQVLLRVSEVRQSGSVPGTHLASERRVPVVSLGPGGEAELNVEMMSPSMPGIYQSRWQLNTPQSVPFGGGLLKRGDVLHFLALL